MTGAALVVQGNALCLPLADESVDLICTSPPYFALRSYRDGDEHYDGQIGSEPTPADFLRALWACMDECWRVLKPTGVAAINLGDKYAGTGGANGNTGLGFTDDKSGKADPRSGPRNNTKQTSIRGEARAKSVMGLPWRFALGLSIPDPYRTCYDPGDHPQWINRRPLIWDKPNGLPESVTDRPRASSEDWFILTKQGRYFAAIDEIREPQQYPNHSSLGKNSDGKRVPHEDDDVTGKHALVRKVRMLHPLGKAPGSVWRIPSEPLLIPEWAKERYNLSDHFAAFPTEWPRRLILAFSPNGICVECNEGRRPVMATSYMGRKENTSTWVETRTPERGWGDREFQRGETATITGYACACTPYRDHKGRGGSGRSYGEAVDLGKPYERDEQGWDARQALDRRPKVGSRREYHFDRWTPPETRPAIVLDPFGGTGTTAVVARVLGRIGISVDLSLDYSRLARWRIHESGHGRKAVQRTAKERQGELL